MQRYILLILLSIISSSGLVMAQSNRHTPMAYVYRIKSAGCTFNGESRRQTGFRVQGIKGIVTALHGIADCKTISAVSDDGEIFNDLIPQAVDIARDTVLLSSGELKNLPDEGLAVSGLSYPEIPREDLRVVGYPLGLDKQDIDINILIRDIEELDDIIPEAEESTDFIERRSPDRKITVLNVQAQLLPGHSGAPLLDSYSQVVGIANGGLRNGTVGRSWAIPWRDVDLQSIEELEIAERLTGLKEQNPGLALSFSSTYPQQLDDGAELKSFRGSVTSETMQPIIGAQVTLIFENTYNIAITDSKGSYRFSFDANSLKKMKEILVEAQGYETTRLVTDQLPDSTIFLKPIRVPIRPRLERGGYIRIISPLGKTMHFSWRSSAPIIATLAAGAIVRIADGPTQDDELQWWKVQSISPDTQSGWILPADADNLYVEPLPLFFSGDEIEIVEERVSFYNSVGINTKPIGSIAQGEKLKVIDGPQESDRYLWYKLERSDGKQVWTKAFGEINYVKIVAPAPISIATALLEIVPTTTGTLTPAVVPTDTNTPTPIATETWIPTLTPTLTNARTSIVTPTVVLETVSTATSTLTSAVVLPTDTTTPTQIATETWTPTLTPISTPTFTTRSTPTETNIPSTNTQIPAKTPIQHLKPNIIAPIVTNNTGDNVHLRSGPGLSYEVIDKLKSNDSLEVTGRHSLFGASDDENWWRVKLHDGREAWVRRDIVDESGNFDEVPIVTEYPTPTSTNTLQLATSTSIDTPTPAPIKPSADTPTPAPIRPSADTPTPAPIRPSTDTPTPASINSQETRPAINTPTPASIIPNADTPTPASIGLEKAIAAMF